MPGRVKTRLIGPYFPEQVAELYSAFVRDMWEMLESFRPHAELFLYADQPHAEWGAARLQRGVTLGERMLNCFLELQAGGFAPLLIVGSDSPALPAALLAPWTERLAQSGSVLGPAEDGGYYAIGCRASHPRMFEGVEWSSPETLAQTEAALARCGLPPAYLAPHYDVDTPQDLVRLAADPALRAHTRKWLQRHYQPD